MKIEKASNILQSRGAEEKLLMERNLMQLLSDRKQVELNQNLVKKPITEHTEEKTNQKAGTDAVDLLTSSGKHWRPQTPTWLWEDERLELAGPVRPIPLFIVLSFLPA